MAKSAEQKVAEAAAKAQAKAEKDAAKAQAKAEKDAAKADKNSVTVTWRGGSRMYSLDIHGEDYEALAEEFADKKGGKVA